MNVTRYAPSPYHHTMITAEQGKYVLFADYERLATEFAEFRRIVGTAAKALADIQPMEPVMVLGAIEEARRDWEFNQHLQKVVRDGRLIMGQPQQEEA